MKSNTFSPKVISDLRGPASVLVTRLKFHADQIADEVANIDRLLAQFTSGQPDIQLKLTAAGQRLTALMAFEEVYE